MTGFGAEGWFILMAFKLRMAKFEVDTSQQSSQHAMPVHTSSPEEDVQSSPNIGALRSREGFFKGFLSRVL